MPAASFSREPFCTRSFQARNSVWRARDVESSSDRIACRVIDEACPIEGCRFATARAVMFSSNWSIFQDSQHLLVSAVFVIIGPIPPHRARSSWQWTVPINRLHLGRLLRTGSGRKELLDGFQPTMCVRELVAAADAF